MARRDQSRDEWSDDPPEDTRPLTRAERGEFKELLERELADTEASLAQLRQLEPGALVVGRAGRPITVERAIERQEAHRRATRIGLGLDRRPTERERLEEVAKRLKRRP